MVSELMVDPAAGDWIMDGEIKQLSEAVIKGW